MIFWMLLGDNNSTNSRFMSSFTGGTTTSLLLAFVAALGFVMLWLVAKHAWANHKSNNIHDASEDSSDE